MMIGSGNHFETSLFTIKIQRRKSRLKIMPVGFTEILSIFEEFHRNPLWVLLCKFTKFRERRDFRLTTVAGANINSFQF